MFDEADSAFEANQFEATVKNLVQPSTGQFPLLDVIKALPMAIYTTDANGRIDIYNRAAAALWGREPVRENERWCGSWRLFHPDGTPLPHEECPMARALKSGEAICGEEAIAERADGSRVSFLAYPTPLRDASGAIIGAVNMLRDITARKAADAQLHARIEQLHVVSELGIEALAGCDLQDLFDRAVARLSEELGVEMVKVLELRAGGTKLLLRAGTGWQPGLVGQACVSTGLGSQAGYTLSVDEPVIVENLNTETRFNGPSLLLDHGVISGLSTIIRGRDKKPFGVLGAHTSAHRIFTSDDIYFLQSVANVLAAAIERKSYQDRQAILVREFSHRVKNNISVIQAIARQTGRHAGSVDSFMRSFEGRLSALAQAQELLTASHGSGASLRELAQLVLAAQGEEDNLDIDIEDVRLSSEGAQTIALVLHELMTNALKYGALSNGKGMVEIRGRQTRAGHESTYGLSWRETGGPPVKGMADAGFGTKLVTSTVKRQCRGELAVDWHPDGLHVDCKFPLSSIAAH
jgi:PAS domain S-box-containing protein